MSNAETDRGSFAHLATALPPEIVLAPGDQGYDEATSPDNSSFEQHPPVVLRPRSAAEAAACVAAVRAAGLRLAVQATGHGAGGPIGPATVLLDTSGLDRVEVDPESRTARVGAGARWHQVQERAWEHGLLGLAGTSPSVGVTGYVVNGGVGWLARPHGLASATLTEVEYVDGDGELRRADDADDSDVVWAFRGGSPVGVATELVLGLVRAQDLWAGYLLWPVERLAALATRWVEQLPLAGPGLTSALAVLRLPPEGPFPDHLLGTVVVHLSCAATGGEPEITELRSAMRDVAEPEVDTTAPADPDVLAGIHLDPPQAVPGRGTGEWLDFVDAEHLVTLLETARIGTDDGLAMVEVRHVAPSADLPVVPGAMTKAPAPLLLHAVGPAPDDEARRRVDLRLELLREAARPATRRSAPGFREGQASTGPAYPREDLERLLAVAERADPDRALDLHRVAGPDSALAVPESAS